MLLYSKTFNIFKIQIIQNMFQKHFWLLFAKLNIMLKLAQTTNAAIPKTTTELGPFTNYSKFLIDDKNLFFLN